LKYLYLFRAGDTVRAGEQVALILRITPSRVRVRISHGAQAVAFGEREFTATKYEYGDWSRQTCAELVKAHDPVKVPLWPLVDTPSTEVVRSGKAVLRPLVKEKDDMASLLSVSKQVSDEPMQIRRVSPPKPVPAKVAKLRQQAADKKADGKPVGKRARARVAKREAKAKVRKEKAVAATAKRVAKGGSAQPRCACGCRELMNKVGSEFARGHYGRYIGMLKNVFRGDSAWDDMPKEVQARVKSMSNLKNILQEHDAKCRKTTKAGGSAKTLWMRKKKRAEARAKK
jgi:hypothetical protein